MRKMQIFFGLLLAFSATNGQITIQSKHMPKAGDTARLSTSLPSNLPSGWRMPGANKSWDFTKITPIGTQLREFKASFRTPYAFYFFNQVGEKIADTLGGGPLTFTNVHSFYTTSNSVYKAEGLGYSITGIPLAANYTDDDEIYQFPLEYNDSDVNTFRFKFDVPGQQLITYIQQGTRTNIVDAYGSLKTPYKTYNDVIRVKTLVNQVDTIVSPLGKTGIPRPQIIYKWLAQGEVVPVLEIRGTQTPLGVFTPTEVLFRDSFRGLPEGGGNGNPGNIVVDFGVDKNIGLAGSDVFTFTNKTSPFARSYTWSFNPNKGIVFTSGTNSNSENPKVQFTEAGSYSVTLTAQMGPGMSRDTTYADLIQIDWGAFKHEVEKSESGCLTVFPVPSNDQLNMRYTCPTLFAINWPSSLKVYNDMGMEYEISKVKVSDDHWYYSIKELPSGLYQIQFMGGAVHFVKM